MSKTVTITYCVPCGYIKRASAAAELLQEKLGVTSELIPGKGGIFQVHVGGELVAQRTRDHFPDTEEIVGVVDSALS